MDWKELLKPSVPKIVLGTIFFVIIPYLSPCYFGPEWGQDQGYWTLCRNLGYDILFGGFAYDLSPHIWGIFSYSTGGLHIVPLAITAVVSYLVSAIIFSFARKKKAT